MRILLFGAGGQVGQELAARMSSPCIAADADIDLIGLDHAALDISDPAAVARALEAARPDVVVNAAAFTDAARAERLPAVAARINAFAPGLVAERCARYRIPLIHLSCACVFGDDKRAAYVESDPIAPRSVHGRTKAAGEAAVRAALDRHLIIRTQWLFGPYGDNPITSIVRRMAHGEHLRVAADDRGCPTAARDLAEALIRAARAAAQGQAPWGTYHFAGRDSISRIGFAREVLRMAARHGLREVLIEAVSRRDAATALPEPAGAGLASDLFTRTFGTCATPWRERAQAVVDALLTAPAPPAPA